VAGQKWRDEQTGENLGRAALRYLNLNVSASVASVFMGMTAVQSRYVLGCRRVRGSRA
jgi:hypothetical protein